MANTVLSTAFYGPLQTLEVTLRNALSCRLTSVYGEEWYDNRCAGLNDRCYALVRQAKRSLHNSVHPHEVVALLSFGFWVSLLGSGGLSIAKPNRKPIMK